MQDLTPQLRTRLTRLERIVGAFVLLAMALLVLGFLVYLSYVRESRGWFGSKVRYFTLTMSAEGLKEGDPVLFLGKPVGEITRIETQPPEDFYAIYVEFDVRAPYYGYIYTDSRAKINATDWLGKRTLEVTKGSAGLPMYIDWEIKEYSLAEARILPQRETYRFADTIRRPNSSEVLVRAHDYVHLESFLKLKSAGVLSVRLFKKDLKAGRVTAKWENKDALDSYVTYQPSDCLFILPTELPTFTERISQLATNLAVGVNGVLSLTNELAAALTNTASLAARADATLAQAQPLISNLAFISAQLREPNGSLGQWLLPTNVNSGLATMLTNANDTLTNATATLIAANTNLMALISQVDTPMRNLSLIMSNLNTQVQANTNFVTQLSGLVVHLDGLVEGFKRHWFLRSAFKEKKPAKK